MTLTQYANLFNLTQDACVLLFALLVFRWHPSRFFRAWTVGYGFEVLIEALEFVATFIGHPLYLGLTQAACIATTAWLFVQAGCLLHDRDLPKASYYAGLVALLAWYRVLSNRVAYPWMVILPVVALAAAHVWLGVAFLKQLGKPQRNFTAWFGIPLLLSGVWFFCYPFLAPTPYFWVGAWGAGLLNLCIGIGILIYLIEGTGLELRSKNAALIETEASLRETQEQLLSRNQELAVEKNLFERLIGNVPASLIYLDPEQRIVWINHHVAQYLKKQPDEIIGHSMFDVFSFIQSPNPRIEAAMRQKEPLTVSGLAYDAGPNGETVYLESTYVPVRDAEDRLEGLLLVILDVTARIENERMQREKIEQLKEIDRLKGDFINAASHELRTPLTSIRGYSEFLEDEIGGPLTPQQLGYVEQIQMGTERLQRIVDDMLDFARLEAGTFQLIPQMADLNCVIATEVASLAPQAAAARISLELRLPEASLMSCFDPQRIGQVLLNLIGNAIKFTPPEGRIVVTASPGPQELRVEVKDTGIGVASENLSRLFEKFYQVNPSLTREHGGAGLGLSISKALVEAHGGILGVESTPGNGSTFWFTLPVVTERTVPVGDKDPFHQA